MNSYWSLCGIVFLPFQRGYSRKIWEYSSKRNARSLSCYCITFISCNYRKTYHGSWFIHQVSCRFDLHKNACFFSNSKSGAKCVSCAYKASAGLLYPLERGFIYITKPPIYINHEMLLHVVLIDRIQQLVEHLILKFN